MRAHPWLLAVTCTVLASCGRDPGPEAAGLLILHGTGIGNTLSLVPAAGGSPQLLSEGLVDVTAPAAFHDGSRLAFAARTPEEPRHALYLVRRDGLRREEVALAPGLVGGVAFLPDGALAFSSSEAGRRDAQDLYRVSAEGGEVQRLTFESAPLVGPVTLCDGRLLFARTSEGGAADRLLAVHPDGTGLAVYAELPHDSGWVVSLAAEEDGDLLVLTRAGAEPRLWQVDVDLPLEEGVRACPVPVAQVHAVHVDAAGRRLLAGNGGVVRALESGTEPLWSPPTGHAVLAVLDLAPRPRPSPHLSLVDPAKDTAELFCIDVRRSQIPAVREAADEDIRRARIRTPEGSVLAEIPVLADGSFAAQVPADTPLQVELLDGRGEVLATEPHAFHLRPAERRGCIGCHESRLAAAPNQMPLALRLADPERAPATGGEVTRRESP